MLTSIRLRQEQKERHPARHARPFRMLRKGRCQQGEADAELERLRKEVKHKALGLLGTIGLTSEDLAAWKVKQEAKVRRQ